MEDLSIEKLEINKNEDLSNLYKYINLKELTIHKHKNVILDISKFGKLEKLIIHTSNIKDLNIKSDTLKEFEFTNNTSKFDTDIFNIPNIESLIFQKIRNKYIKELYFPNIELFAKLKFLDISDNNINNLVLKSSSLEILKADHCKLMYYQLDTPELKELSLIDNNIITININHLKKLTKLNVSDNKLVRIDINSESLESLNINENKIYTDINIYTPNLLEFYINYNSIINELNFNPIYSKGYINYSDKKLTGYPSKLIILESNNLIKDKTYIDLINLKVLTISMSNIFKINIPMIEKLDIDNIINELKFEHSNSLKELNLSGNTYNLTINDCYKLEKLITEGLNSFNYNNLPLLKELTLDYDSGLSNTEIIFDKLYNLEIFNIELCKFQTVTIDLPKLKKLSIVDNIQNLNIINSDLRELELYNSDINNIDFNSIPKLEKLKIDTSNNIDEIVINNNNFIESIHLEEIELSKLHLINLPKLTYLYYFNNEFEAQRLNDLILENLPNIEEIIFSNIALQEDISFLNYNKLNKLNISRCDIKNINIKNLISLQNLYIMDNPRLETININNFHKLEHINLSSNNLNKINVNNLPSLITVSIDNNPFDNLIIFYKFDKLQTIYTDKLYYFGRYFRSLLEMMDDEKYKKICNKCGSYVYSSKVNIRKNKFCCC